MDVVGVSLQDACLLPADLVTALLVLLREEVDTPPQRADPVRDWTGRLYPSPLAIPSTSVQERNNLSCCFL